jgi:putative N-acetyltransferase (TIGR04045 family)
VIDVRPAQGDREVAAALALRERVFCGEQGVSLEGDRDGLDPEALQLVALNGHDVVGTCRVLVHGADARFGRLCVVPGARRRGLGARLLAEAEREARAAGARRMHLHAQVAAMDLYRRAGYRTVGEPFDDEGLEHLAMERELA